MRIPQELATVYGWGNTKSLFALENTINTEHISGSKDYFLVLWTEGVKSKHGLGPRYSRYERNDKAVDGQVGLQQVRLVKRFPSQGYINVSITRMRFNFCPLCCLVSRVPMRRLPVKHGFLSIQHLLGQVTVDKSWWKMYFLDKKK